MADGVDLTIDSAKLAKDGQAIVERFTAAGGKAVAGAGKGLERALEAATRSAVPGRLWRAWSSAFYPNQRDNAASIVFVNGKPGGRARGAMTFWSRPGEVRARNGRFLAVPLPAAGKAKTPEEWENLHNTDLEFVPRRGRAALLVAETGGLTRRGTFRRLSVKRLKAGQRGKVTVPIFVLISAVKFRNTVAIEPLVAASERDLVATFLAAAR